jgi:hypothetical protein
LREKIIPAFEQEHRPGYQALIMVDNSQGHSAYSEDALLTTRMNVNPGGKQGRLQDGWFVPHHSHRGTTANSTAANGTKVSQLMIYPADHPDFPDQPKGIKNVLLERGFDVQNLRGKCKKCDADSETCCCKRILELQPDFQEQQSLVQEVIEKAGHLSIFLPKFHCELNFIEFFWGAVKRYLREHCDYTFDTLKENVPKALNSVPLETIR